MSGQTAVITALMAVVFLAVAAAMLTGGTGQPAPAPVHGRNRRNARRRQETDTPDVFDRVLAEASVGMLLPFLTVVPDPEPVGALPFVPGPDYRDEPDDWWADLPTGQLPALTDVDLADYYDDVTLAGIRFAARARAHTSPSATAADAWPPIFAALATEMGYDPVRGFDGLTAAA